MTKMIQLIEEMDARLSQIADAENELVRALGHALSRVDQRLLQDVRKITTEHESRRGAILHELQGLATRIGFYGLNYYAPHASDIIDWPSVITELRAGHT